ncbi:MAG: hypothetical protein ACREUG_03690, partial [Steroidobacteraceae bacterium]
ATRALNAAEWFRLGLRMDFPPVRPARNPLYPVSEIAGPPLIPICPNCHAVVHRRDPPLSPDELRELLRKRA